MKIKLDENLPDRLVAALTALGHDMDTVYAERLTGQVDPDVWSATQAVQRFFITQDLDFQTCDATRRGLTQACCWCASRDPAAAPVDVRRELSDRRIAGVLQLTYIPCLTYKGGWRALIEGVRVSASLRSTGIGRRLFQWAVGRARQRGCHLVQLSSDKTRPDAIRFYESLGFVASHEGLKLHLTAPPERGV